MGITASSGCKGLKSHPFCEHFIIAPQGILKTFLKVTAHCMKQFNTHWSREYEHDFRLHLRKSLGNTLVLPLALAPLNTSDKNIGLRNQEWDSDVPVLGKCSVDYEKQQMWVFWPVESICIYYTGLAQKSKSNCFRWNKELKTGALYPKSISQPLKCWLVKLSPP